MTLPISTDSAAKMETASARLVGRRLTATKRLSSAVRLRIE
jgi:hypothetical protein